ncbi:MAG: SGNH/GDSL hydrolase family protein [Candidatus Omnitrophica bacterium]|nr:SGNH/GDSL hydrolase family protein [Candidatus Omnitrophota bacterium]
MRRMIRLLIVICIILGLVLAVGEIYTQKKYKRPYLTGFMEAHPVFHHLPQANYRGEMKSEGDFDFEFTTNNRGMRGPGDYVYEKPEGVFRIAVLGDSFVFGVGVGEEKTAVFLLEELLNKTKPGGASYEVHNFGVNSFSPVLEYIYLKEEVVKYKPDLVVLMLDACDIQDDYFYEPRLVYDESGNITGCDPLKINGKSDIYAFLLKHSSFLNTLDHKLIESFRKMKAIGLKRYFSNKINGIRNKTDILTVRDRDNIYFDRFLMFREDKDIDIVMKHWQRTERFLMLIKKFLDKREIPLVMVLYPYGHQVGQRQWSKGRSYWAFDRNRVYYPHWGFSVIEEFAGNRDINVINLYERFRDRKHEKLYYNNDGHWTEEGQRIAAEGIFNSDIFQKALK